MQVIWVQICKNLVQMHCLHDMQQKSSSKFISFRYFEKSSIYINSNPSDAVRQAPPNSNPSNAARKAPPNSNPSDTARKAPPDSIPSDDARKAPPNSNTSDSVRKICWNNAMLEKSSFSKLENNMEVVVVDEDMTIVNDTDPNIIQNNLPADHPVLQSRKRVATEDHTEIDNVNITDKVAHFYGQ